MNFVGNLVQYSDSDRDDSGSDGEIEAYKADEGGYSDITVPGMTEQSKDKCSKDTEDDDDDDSDDDDDDTDVNCSVGEKRKIPQPKDLKTNCLKKSKAGKKMLPLPKEITLMFEEPEFSGNNSTDSKGRIRTFAHVDGDWASFVYIPVKSNSAIQNLLKKITAKTKSCFPDFHESDSNELHITLSRTVTFRHYWIHTIVSKLREVFQYNRSFVCHLDLPEFYTNDEKTRTFLGLRVIIGEEKLNFLARKIDNIFAEFGLPRYYENPSFHISVAWHLGDVACDAAKRLTADLQEIMESSEDFVQCRTVEIGKILLKTGNKVYLLKKFDI